MACSRISISLSDEELAELDAAARLHGVSRSYLIRSMALSQLAKLRPGHYLLADHCLRILERVSGVRP